MVSHSMDEVAENVDRIVVLANAGVVMSGTPPELVLRVLEDQAHPEADVPYLFRLRPDVPVTQQPECARAIAESL